MGMQIHKIMGYGLNNIVADKDDRCKCIDPRIDTDLFQSEEYWGKIDDVDGFFTWIEENEEECKELLRAVEPTRRNRYGSKEIIEARKSTAFDFDINWALMSWRKKETKYNRYAATYDSEFGLKEILLFSNIEDAEWYRFDNTIDYYEAEDNEPHVKELLHHCGIYPYLGVVHIPHAPNFGKEGYPTFLEPAHYSKMMGNWSEKMDPLLTGEQFEYFKKWYRPVIPPIILLHIKFLNIFKYYNETVQELRPMIYTYWG